MPTTKLSFLLFITLVWYLSFKKKEIKLCSIQIDMYASQFVEENNEKSFVARVKEGVARGRGKVVKLSGVS